jgi:type 2 lantibiotic biosynthesis protein LanM
MDDFVERLIMRAATIDELLSDDFEALPGQKDDAELAARRLVAWCRSCASGNWSLFGRRLDRDGLSIVQVLERFATVRRRASASTPAWINDAIWIKAALQSETKKVNATAAPGHAEPCAFEELFAPAVEHAEARLWLDIDARAFDNLNESARACLRASLLKELCSLCAPAIYELFAKARKASVASADAARPQRDGATLQYDQFIAEMKAGGFRRLFHDKPVLLRLVAAITRQWIETSRELVMRLDADLAIIRREILNSASGGRVANIEGDLSDPHNGGHSVQIVSFEDASRVVYKPKDMRLDLAWYNLVKRLNRADSPIELKAVLAIARDEYGWTEFIDHTGCADQNGCKRFFRRAGAWLALFHCFAAADMHQENLIAAGDHPVPIDLEMILQSTVDDDNTQDPDGQAFAAAVKTVTNSVMMVGLVPAYLRSPKNNVFSFGGMDADWKSKKIRLTWNNINSDAMRPAISEEASNTIPNLPHVDGRHAKFGDHIEDFVGGFADYTKFLLRQTRDAEQGMLFADFAGLPVRKVIRPTRFYFMLAQRLKNHRSMDDGVVWSAQADFLARLADWEKDSDPLWPLQQAERSALGQLNVPHFVSPSDGNEIRDASGVSISIQATSGMDRARARVLSLDEQEIAWQIEVIRQNSSSLATPAAPPAAAAEPKSLLHSKVAAAPTKEIFSAEADKIAGELAGYAIRRGPGAAWIGLDWLGDAEVFQLAPLGPELYNGVSGIAVFFAAHAAVTRFKPSGVLAHAAISSLRKNLQSRNAARMARSLGIGGATGLGSILYALAVMSKCLRDDELLVDALAMAELFTDELIAADKLLDVMGGSAGAILSLLRLYRDTRSGDVLRRATKCGEHLLGQRRVGPIGHRSWVGQGLGPNALNGMSHGAAGFAYALASLSAATERQDFASAAAECLAFEDSSYDPERRNWPDLRLAPEPGWPCQWCHGAVGIGLARLAMNKRGGLDCKLEAPLGSGLLATDIRNASEGVERDWPNRVDTLCCGTLGSIEFFCEAAGALGRKDLRELASRRLLTVLETAALTGDYRWNTGKRQFNLGLFRGLAGVGYTFLRLVDGSLPNVLVWD